MSAKTTELGGTFVIGAAAGMAVMAAAVYFTSPVWKRGQEAYGMECVERSAGRCVAFRVTDSAGEGVG